jgi:hypothetical protein
VSAIRLYFDEDSMQHRLIDALRLHGIEVMSALESNMLATTDLEQLEWAAARGFTVYTYNVGDFARLHRHLLEVGSSHSGIIIAPQQRYSISGQLRRLLQLINTRSSEEMRDRIEFLSNWF